MEQWVKSISSSEKKAKGDTQGSGVQKVEMGQRLEPVLVPGIDVFQENLLAMKPLVLFAASSCWMSMGLCV